MKPSAEVEVRARKMLSAAGLRCTPGRMGIIEALMGGGGPMSEQQILDEMGKTGLNKTTVYRAIHSFVENGIVHQAYIKDRTAFFELGHRCGHRQCHPHFTCTQCGKTECLPETHLPLAEVAGGFKVTRQKVELEGLCPKCHENC